jgi:hypothetical protein
MVRRSHVSVRHHRSRLGNRCLELRSIEPRVRLQRRRATKGEVHRRRWTLRSTKTAGASPHRSTSSASRLALVSTITTTPWRATTMSFTQASSPKQSSWKPPEYSLPKRAIISQPAQRASHLKTKGREVAGSLRCRRVTKLYWRRPLFPPSPPFGDQRRSPRAIIRPAT